MYPILEKSELAEHIYRLKVRAPRVAHAAQPGQFVIVRADEFSERIPLTIADYDAAEGSVTLVIQAIGASTRKICALEAGDSLADFAGPLGHPSEFVRMSPEELRGRRYLFVAGGVGTAPVYPQVKWLHEHGVQVDVIIGAKTARMLIYTDEMRAVATNLFIATDDGSEGFRGMVTQQMEEQNSAELLFFSAVIPCILSTKIPVTIPQILIPYKEVGELYNAGLNEFMMQPPIREALGLPEFDVRGLYRAVEIIGRNKEPIVTAFRKRFLAEYGPEVTDTVFDWTSLVYFGDKPEKAMRGHSKDGHPEECQVMVGVAQLAKPLGVPIGLTVMPGNTHDGKHMLETFSQVREDLTDGSTMIFDAGANNKAVLDTIVEDSKHYLTRKRFNKSDDAILAGFSEETWECIDAEKGEYCLKRVFPSRVNYYFFSRELCDLEKKGVEKRARKK